MDEIVAQLREYQSGACATLAQNHDATDSLRLWHDQYRAGQLDEPSYHQLIFGAFDLPQRNVIQPEDVDPQFIERIPIGFARRFHMIGVRSDGSMRSLVTCDPWPPSVIDHVATWIESPVQLELAPADVIERAINESYSAKQTDFSGVIPSDEISRIPEELAAINESDLLDDTARAPVIKLVNLILFEAVKRRASDVHIHPFPEHVQIRYRVDGILYDYLEVPRRFHDEIVSRVKIIGKMDIAEKRISQDGRTTVTVGEKNVDLRISIIPTNYGERVVLRLLDKSARLYKLPELGMSPRDQRKMAQLIERPHGIILVTGPTGSGKSTTLYAALQYLDYTEKNILTLEDPIEYQLPGISQMQVSYKKGMTFATGLRAVLRQDPDVIMVGEIRDEETARMAVQSSLTGHLVFSTLHTNDAAGAIARLLDLGIEPYLVTSTLLAVLAQRLVRILCPGCSIPRALSSQEQLALRTTIGTNVNSIMAATGCAECSHTGYRGRIGAFELLIVDEPIRESIMRRAKATEIRDQAIRGGMTTLREDGIRKVVGGETTLEEVGRITFDEAIERGEVIEEEFYFGPNN